MENHQKGREQPKKVKILNTSSLQINEKDASQLVGSIVEKGISDSHNNPTTPFISFPKPTVLPFPVARHRSHGPHWRPLRSGKDDDGEAEDSDNNVEDEEDKIFQEFERVSAFAKPVQRRRKTGLDFRKWKEISSDDGSSLGKESVEGVSSFSQTTGKKKYENDSNSRNKKTSSSDDNVISPMKLDTKPLLDDSDGGFINSTKTMDIDTSNKVDHQEQSEFASGLDQICPERMPDYNFGSLEEQRPGQTHLNSSMPSFSNSNSIISDQKSMSLESEINYENQVRIQKMSAQEIAEAQAEIMEKMSPALLEVLQKRGQEKLKKRDILKSEVGIGSESLKGYSHSLQVAKHLHTENGVSQTLTTPPSKEKLDDKKISSQTSTTASSSLWNSWSSRVEAVRELRFSLDGDVVDSERSSVYGNLTERDYLRTEGDPGAAGYTIKEAVALTRSVIPGQRALALHLLSSLLDKALHNICKDRTRHMTKPEDKVDWEAVWAFALGPEPELVLSLRICLDDNHNSVVLACAKVVQCVLSCDENENYCDISEIATCDMDICTAPVFRSKPDINVGFLQGGFWKYSAKPSNILPFSDDSMDNDNETEGKHTIQDDVVIAGQDFTVGLVRMGILPRLRYLLETDPMTTLEESIISILIAIARHSPTCANAVLKCERLVQTIVNRFTADNFEIRSSMIKSVRLFKVLARLNRIICLEFIKKGYFQAMIWNLYQSPSSVDQWLRLGKEKCKLMSALIVEQLRFWRVCIQYGYCVSYFSEMFPALCFWLNPLSFEKLVENNVFNEYTSISREAYLVLESLSGRLPNLYSKQCLNNQLPESAGDTEVWSWSYVGPMVDLAIRWIATRSDPEVFKFFEGQQEGRCDYSFRGFSSTPLLWLYTAVTNMLFRVLERMTWGGTMSPHETEGHVPWLPEFVPKIGLELIKHWLLGFSASVGTKCGGDSEGESFIKELIYLRQKDDIEMSLASTCCLNGILKIITTIDNLIQSAKIGIPSQEEQSLEKEGKVLKSGIVNGFMVDLRYMLDVFMFSVSSGWHHVQSIESFGRGGPVPGAGIGWGAPGGGFWSMTVLLAQTDARFLVCLLEIFEKASKDVVTEETAFAVQRVNASLGLCLTAGPRDKVVVEKTLDLLLQVSLLKHLDLCIQNYLSNKTGKTFSWQHEEADYIHFSNMLSSHFRSRWLSEKVKSKAVDGSSSSGIKTSPKVGSHLETIYEDLDMSSMTSPCCNTLTLEWAHQKLPLPAHFYLSPISTIFHSKRAGSHKVDDVLHNPSNLLEVARCGLFFVLGVEAMSNYQGHIPSPVHHVSLTWKLHSLSVNFVVGMEILEHDRSRDNFEALQDLYGELLDRARFNQSKDIISEDKKNQEFLRFQSEIHESYPTFIEELIEQFSAVSYGDVIFGRQVSLYLHRCVETSIRLAAWNTLSNARVLELLPPLEKCLSSAEGYLEPTEDNEAILEAYAKSWVSDALDRAAIRGSVAYTLVVHHLCSFIFHACPTDKLLLRNRLVRSLLRDYAGKSQHERMLLNLIHHNKSSTSVMDEQLNGVLPEKSWLESRFKILVEACEGNSSLLTVVDKLKGVLEEKS
ncbi:hypothetical protein PHAVU_003G039700 [Phaseolus vulgaris]|uniref:RNA polymerase II-associated protein 1 C-terminal domain-containing protein n=1 Tax=Phaseolus vulgaris TaxID=3885 RepID=V7C879_PHAVU|nr:hypothetical protein PHAVU_003G039700g [Phaseolus vulgaris]ESW25480.1 hypothetical protein PHAVU_003G039700g [Phaseolus vulgaris]